MIHPIHVLHHDATSNRRCFFSRTFTCTQAHPCSSVHHDLANASTSQRAGCNLGTWKVKMVKMFRIVMIILFLLSLIGYQLFNQQYNSYSKAKVVFPSSYLTCLSRTSHNHHCICSHSEVQRILLKTDILDHTSLSSLSSNYCGDFVCLTLSKTWLQYSFLNSVCFLVWAGNHLAFSSLKEQWWQVIYMSGPWSEGNLMTV